MFLGDAEKWATCIVQDTNDCVSNDLIPDVICLLNCPLHLQIVSWIVAQWNHLLKFNSPFAVVFWRLKDVSQNNWSLRCQDHLSNHLAFLKGCKLSSVEWNHLLTRELLLEHVCSHLSESSCWCVWQSANSDSSGAIQLRCLIDWWIWILPAAPRGLC